MWTGDEVILPAKPPSPPHAFTPDTPGRDVDSDELSFAKWRRSPSAERKKKKKSGLKHAITPEQMLYARQAKEKVPYQEDPASSGMESPSTAFAATVNKSTGYSPLNPTVPLQAAFQDLTPSFVMQAPFASPSSTVNNTSEWLARMRAKEQVSRTNPPSPVQMQPSTSSSEEVATDMRTPRIKGIRTSRTASPAIPASTFPTSSPTAEILLNPTPPVTTPSLLAEKPIIFAASTPPVAAHTPWVETPITPARPSFDAARPALFQRAFFDSIRGVKFDDTHVYVYAARSRAGVAHRPRVVHARSDFLKAASAVFENGLYDGCVVDPGSVPARRASRTEYGYDCDSDLEDDEEDAVVEPTQAKENIPVPSTGTAKAAQTGTEATPKSSTLSVTDLDVMSLDDFKSDHSTSDATEEATRTLVAATNGNSTADPARTPSKPSLSLATNDAVLNWRAAQEKLTAVPAERAVEAPPVQVSKETTAQGADGAAADGRASIRDMRERTLFIPDSAHRTWQALLLYLYNDYLEFAPLRSQRQAGVVQPSVSDAPTCSPKSMYRLAIKLGLDILRDQSFTALRQALSRENIVEELFSDFTWRYPEVLKMETEIFHRYSSDAAVQTAMAEKFQEIAYGQLPHSSIVLNSLFMRFIGGGLPSLTGPPRVK